MHSSSAMTLILGSFLVSSLLIVFGLRRLTKTATAQAGIRLIGSGLLLGAGTALFEQTTLDWRFLAGGALAGSLAGLLLAARAGRSAPLSVVPLFAAATGAAVTLSGLVVSGVVDSGSTGSLERVGGGAISGLPHAVSLSLGIGFGAIACGLGVSLAALHRRTSAFVLPARAPVNVLLSAASLLAAGWLAVLPTNAAPAAFVLIGSGLLLGTWLVLPGARTDRVVFASLANVAAGAAIAAIGFALASVLLVVVGALIGGAALVLARISAASRGRSLAQVVFGGEDAAARIGGGAAYRNARALGIEEAALSLEEVRSVVVVPGYGLAVAQAQNALRELGALLVRRGVSVRYAIHPQAGRMPGHLNALLAEADVPYDMLGELEHVNPMLASTDLVIVVGANDIVNPAAYRSPESPLYGVPVFEVEKAKSVFVIKRSLAPGHENVRNELFEAENTLMLYGDAKKVLQALATELKSSGLAHAA